MKPRTVGILAACGVIALAGGWYFGAATTPPEQQTVQSGKLAFPGLAAMLPNAAKIEIVHQGDRTVIAKRSDGGWGVAAMQDYPVQRAKL
ncbi:MAG TPA: hypothetical protein VHO91_13060, partial [Rhodopila sp.]|nr:hypothetical protein [Rhodopila sp.]